MNWRLIAWLAGIFVAALVLAEVLLQPPDRRRAVAPPGNPRCTGVRHRSPGAVAAAVGVRPHQRRRHSVAGGLVLADTRGSHHIGCLERDVPVVARLPAVPRRAGAVERHRPRGRLAAHPAARSLDIARLGEVAEQVAAGDFTARTGIRPPGRGRSHGSGRRLDGDGPRRRGCANVLGRRLRARCCSPASATTCAPRSPRCAPRSRACRMASHPIRIDTSGWSVNELDNVEALLDQLVEFARIESGQSNRERTDRLGRGARTRGDRGTVAGRPPIAMLTCGSSPTAQRSSSRAPLDSQPGAAQPGGERHPAHPIAARPSLWQSAPGADIEVAVHDHGEGFPADFRDHAFDPFTRADPARDTRTGHAGLGLAITRALVEAHGGRIWLARRPRRRCAILVPRKEPSS